jgi:FMN phosphatase YigB (HAD superfamily)
MTQQSDLVFLIDCDNTLLDNDRVQQELSAHLAKEFGADCRDRYWRIFEQLRTELGYADYLGALQLYRVHHERDTRLLRMSSFLIDYPFPDRLYPQALDVIRHLSTMGTTVILSDGDVAFQPRKIERSGIRDAVDGRVLIYIHKERMLDAITEAYPARTYVMIDDKLRVLAAMKQEWRDRLTTVFPRQGHYAFDEKILAQYPAADITVDRIGELMTYERAAFDDMAVAGSQEERL